MTTRAPSGVPTLMVDVAVRTLQREHRDRYRLEFTADLWDLPRRSQFRYATGVLVRSLALRSALTTPTARGIPEDAMTFIARPPLTCRLHIRHKWHTATTEDGDRYGACLWCGKEQNPPVMAGPLGLN